MTAESLPGSENICPSGVRDAFKCLLLAKHDTAGRFVRPED